jgi:hypothetical protein
LVVKQEGTTAAATEYTSYTSILKAKVLGQTKISLVIANSHETAAVNAKVYVSNDPEGSAASFAPLELVATEGVETVLPVAAASAQPIEIDMPYAWVDVQIQSEDENSPQATAWLIATE